MIVNETDYTFTSTGSSQRKFGKIKDCNGRHFINPCPHFSKATIDTSGTGLIIDPRVWGIFQFISQFVLILVVIKWLK